VFGLGRQASLAPAAALALRICHRSCVAFLAFTPLLCVQSRLRCATPVLSTAAPPRDRHLPASAAFSIYNACAALRLSNKVPGASAAIGLVPRPSLAALPSAWRVVATVSHPSLASFVGMAYAYAAARPPLLLAHPGCPANLQQEQSSPIAKPAAAAGTIVQSVDELWRLWLAKKNLVDCPGKYRYDR